MNKLRLTILILCLSVALLFAQYSFDFSCLDDTIQQGVDVIEFDFLLENTGSLPDSYAFDCRVIDSVPGWIEIYCVGGTCTEPGEILYSYLDVAQVDSTINLRVFPTPGFAIEVVNLHVQSIGNPSLRDSINVYAVGVNGIEEGKQTNLNNPRITVYPNPFGRKTDIKYSIGHNNGVDSRQKSVVSMKIYDATGRLIKQFPRFTPDALHPTHISWDGTDNQGVNVPAGVYFIQLGGNDLNTEKIIKFR